MKNFFKIMPAWLLILWLGLIFTGRLQAEAIHLPQVMDEAKELNKPYFLKHNGKDVQTTIEPYLQRHLTDYIQAHYSPIAAVVVAEVKTGKILAVAQGMRPDKWGSKVHTALHSFFPAASVFKTVAATASIELLGTDVNKYIGLQGGCGEVPRNGVWMRDQKPKKHFRMSLKKAYGLSCNGYFAKVSVNELGLGTLLHYASKFKWNEPIPADFFVPISPMRSPSPKASSALTVGKFGAGFGYVGMNAFHGAWIMLTLARDGYAVPLVLQNTTTTPEDKPLSGARIFEENTAKTMLGIMDSTVRGGTAHFAFQNRKFWKVRRLAGGKTGTLTGDNPKGMTTWFAGMMPLKDPEVVVAAVVMLEDLWHIKGANLAAEAFYAYRYMIQKKKRLSQTSDAAKSAMKETTK